MNEFDMVQPELPADVPTDLAERLTDPGVPRRLLGEEYIALDKAVWLTPDLLAFGTCGYFGRICLETGSGAVVHAPEPQSPLRSPVNADLDRFDESVAAVRVLFPFYSDDSEADEWEAAAEQLRATLLGIDTTAGEHNGFWETFLDDVAMGDYAPRELSDR
jgi:hypothetical protein